MTKVSGKDFMKHKKKVSESYSQGFLDKCK